MRRRLLALDMDGTLLRPDGSIDPRDEAALHGARQRGVLVTLATGRVAGGALPTARALGLDVPLICADGGLLVDARTGVCLESRTLPLRIVDDVLAAHARHEVVPFVLRHDRVHCDQRGLPYTDYVRIWTDDVTVHERLETASDWRVEDTVALAVGLGGEAATGSVLESVRDVHGAALELLRFPVQRLADHWVLITRPAGCTKGAALERLARSLHVEREDTAAVGDWHNDLSMFAWAARSFAMGQAPERVRRAATDTLEASVLTGGGVSEAIARWLGDA